LHARIRLFLKKLDRTNTLAYFSTVTVTKKVLYLLIHGGKGGNLEFLTYIEN